MSPDEFGGRPMKQRDWKAESVKQWNADPCGADKSTAFGTREFFRKVEQERAEYAPWIPEVIDFKRFTGQRVLEIGFGLGTDFVAFIRAGAECFGIDLTPAHIDGTRKRLILESRPVRLTRADAENLPFADRSFDLAYSFGVLHHTPGTKQAIDEIFRVLRPGGKAVVVLYHRDSAFWLYTVLVRGLIKGELFRAGYRRLMTQIEKREASDAVPLVKVYGRWEARRMFSKFHDVRTEVRHLGLSGSRGLLRRFAERHSEALGRRFGWYLIIEASKK